MKKLIANEPAVMWEVIIVP